MAGTVAKKARSDEWSRADQSSLENLYLSSLCWSASPRAEDDFPAQVDGVDQADHHGVDW
jgi:hypothetical protein